MWTARWFIRRRSQTDFIRGVGAKAYWNTPTPRGDNFNDKEVEALIALLLHTLWMKSRQWKGGA
jgi:hypothetical protein